MELPKISFGWVSSTVTRWWNMWLKRTFFTFVGPLLCYVLFLNHVEPSEFGLARNAFDAKLWVQVPGWHCTPPWVRVSNIDGRPMRVTVPSSGRGFSAKLVQFDAGHYKEFVETEGFRYYWWSNRFSYNAGHDEEYRGMRDIMRGYAYGAKEYPFIVVLKEITRVEVP